MGSCVTRVSLNASIADVVAHELAHLREMNHGPRFWSTVATLMPGFEAARRQLKDYPDDLAMS